MSVTDRRFILALAKAYFAMKYGWKDWDVRELLEEAELVAEGVE